MQHHPKEKKFTGMFQVSDSKKKEEDSGNKQPKTEKAVLKSILKVPFSVVLIPWLMNFLRARGRYLH